MKSRLSFSTWANAPSVLVDPVAHGCSWVDVINNEAGGKTRIREPLEFLVLSRGIRYQMEERAEEKVESVGWKANS